MEDRQYFILDNNSKKGPFSLNELKQQPISEDTLVWYSGIGDWTKAIDIPDLDANLVLLRTHRSNKKMGLWVGSIIALIAIVGMVWGKQLFTKKEKILPITTTLNNEELYTRLSSGVVLIQQKFLYVIHISGRSFYFNELFDEGNEVYLAGLTEDSSLAIKTSEPIQGTGFFISKDGKLLTNRHVAVEEPKASQFEATRRALLQAIEQQDENKHWEDSVQKQKVYYDSLLTALKSDSLADAVHIADIREKLSNTESILNYDEGEEYKPLTVDSATADLIRSGEIEVKKITLELRIFLPGMQVETDKGIPCSLIATSEKDEVDLALLQTDSHQLPDTTIKPFDLSRIKSIIDGKKQPQMSERLILIGYNEGTWISNTSEGIKAQLTEGKISQNTDSYKLMYTIPTLPGSSGSPVLDERGRLVAVNFAGISSTQNFNYGIQPTQVGRFLKAQGISW